MVIDHHIKEDYARCAALARAHYENFPVMSFLMPRKIRGAVAAIYAFARLADDIADESILPLRARQKALADFAEKIKKIAQHETVDAPYFLALSHTVHSLKLDPQLLLDLLTAFSFDITLHTLPDQATLFWYCRHSANPIGRLLLQLFKVHDPKALVFSDALCTSLQLINFLQDWHDDLMKRSRLYFPLTELAKYDLTVQDLKEIRDPARINALLQAKWLEANTLLKEATGLLTFLPWQYRLHIALVILGGRGIMRLLKGRETPEQRPVLSMRTLLKGLF